MKPIKYFDPFTQIIVSDTINESDRSILPFIFSGESRSCKPAHFRAKITVTKSYTNRQIEAVGK